MLDYRAHKLFWLLTLPLRLVGWLLIFVSIGAGIAIAQWTEYPTLLKIIIGYVACEGISLVLSLRYMLLLWVVQTAFFWIIDVVPAKVKRQRAAIEGFAKRAGFALVGEFSDPGVSGADPIEVRPGFSALLDRIEGNGVHTVIVEDASRFARELVTQELGIIALIKRGVRVLTASGDDLTDSSDPSRKMMRQIAGSFAEYEKARLVAKLRAARQRKRETVGKCEVHPLTAV